MLCNTHSNSIRCSKEFFLKALKKKNLKDFEMRKKPKTNKQLKGRLWQHLTFAFLQYSLSVILLNYNKMEYQKVQ